MNYQNIKFNNLVNENKKLFKKTLYPPKFHSKEYRTIRLQNYYYKKDLDIGESYKKLIKTCLDLYRKTIKTTSQ